MQWWIVKNGANTGVLFDDGILCNSPGDAEFTRSGIDAHLKTLSAGHTADYAMPTFPQPEEPAEEQPNE